MLSYFNRHLGIDLYLTFRINSSHEKNKDNFYYP